MYFPTDYLESRRQFRHLIETLPAPKQIEHWPVPSSTDDDLIVDVAYLPPLIEPRRLFVMISGTHGSETYAGSAIQNMFLTEIWPGVDRSNIGLLIVHSLNPYGFKNHRRWTENLVNLNRNCSIKTDIYGLSNHRSVELFHRFIPRTPVNGMESDLYRSVVQRDGKIYLDEIHFDDFIKTTSFGQFTYPHGFEFGGFRAEPQIIRLSEKLKQLMPLYRDVIEIDLHTGLGNRGELHILTDGHEEGLEKTLMSELFHVADERALYDFTPWEAEGFYKTVGATNNLFVELKTPGQRVCALTFEYGTFGHSFEAQMRGTNLSALEHQGMVNGYGHTDLEKQIAREILERSYPSDDSWKNQVIDTTREVLKRVFMRAEAL